MKLLFCSTNIGINEVSKMMVWVANQWFKQSHDLATYDMLRQRDEATYSEKDKSYPQIVDDTCAKRNNAKLGIQLFNYLNRTWHEH